MSHVAQISLSLTQHRNEAHLRELQVESVKSIVISLVLNCEDSTKGRKLIRRRAIAAQLSSGLIPVDPFHLR